MPVTVSALANMLLISNTLNLHVGDRNSSTVHCRACSFHATRQRGHCITESWKTHQPPGFGNSGGFPLSGNKQPDRQALSPHNYSPFGHISVGAAIRFQCGTQFPNTFPTSPFFTDAFLTNKPCIKIFSVAVGQSVRHVMRCGQWAKTWGEACWVTWVGHDDLAWRWYLYQQWKCHGEKVRGLSKHMSLPYQREIC